MPKWNFIQKNGGPLTASTIRKAQRWRQVHRRTPAPNCYTKNVRKRTRRAESIRIAIAILLGALFAPRTGDSLDAKPSGSSPDSASPIELVRTAVANEVAAANDNSVKHMFRSRKQTPQGSQTRLYVETREAMAG